jgi:hypothetical protein
VAGAVPAGVTVPGITVGVASGVVGAAVGVAVLEAPLPVGVALAGLSFGGCGVTARKRITAAERRAWQRRALARFGTASRWGSGQDAEAARERVWRSYGLLKPPRFLFRTDAVVGFVTEAGGTATFAEIRDALLCPPGPLGGALHSLVRSGRLVHVSRGVYALPGADAKAQP